MLGCILCSGSSSRALISSETEVLTAQSPLVAGPWWRAAWQFAASPLAAHEHV